MIRFRLKFSSQFITIKFDEKLNALLAVRLGLGLLSSQICE